MGGSKGLWGDWLKDAELEDISECMYGDGDGDVDGKECLAKPLW